MEKEKLKNYLDQVELPSPAYRVTAYVCAALVAAAGLFFAYEVAFVADWHFKVEWNMFKSWLFWPLFIVGELVALVHIGKNHYSQETWTKTTYRDGSVKVERDWDITTVMTDKILLPFVGHFIMEPLGVVAAIYYPLMCVLALLGWLFPYLLALLVVALCGGAAYMAPRLTMPGRVLVLAAMVLVLGVGLGWGGLAIQKAYHPWSFQEAAGATVHPGEMGIDMPDPDDFDGEAPATGGQATPQLPENTDGESPDGGGETEPDFD